MKRQLLQLAAVATQAAGSSFGWMSRRLLCRRPAAKAVRRTALCLMVCSMIWRPTHAHEGPPFPIIVDEHIGSYVVSVWTDPDIGTGTFFVVLEPPDGGTLPEATRVQVAVRPVSNRLDEVVYEADAQAVRYGARYYAEVEFDQGEMWAVRIIISGSEGGGELTSEVEATPDGTIGPIGLVVYALPFLAVAFLWLKAVMRKRRPAESRPAERTPVERTPAG